jgi:hypothetical protein
LRTIFLKVAIVFHKDHRDEIVDARVWRMVKGEARESPVRFLEPLPIRRGSGGPQKAFSWLSEGVRGVFTNNTEASERPCVPYLHNFGATPRSSWVAGASCSHERASSVCRETVSRQSTLPIRTS